MGERERERKLLFSNCLADSFRFPCKSYGRAKKKKKERKKKIKRGVEEEEEKEKRAISRELRRRRGEKKIKGSFFHFHDSFASSIA